MVLVKGFGLARLNLRIGILGSFFMKKLLLGAALGALTLHVPAAAETVEETAARFGIRQSVMDISLSPSGTKVAFIAPGAEHSEVLNVVDLQNGGGIRTIISNTEQNGDLDDCEWATDTRLVCRLYGIGRRGSVLLPFTRMLAINDDGGEVLQLSERTSDRQLYFRQDGGDVIAFDIEGDDGRILMTKQYVKERTIGTRLANDKDGLGVDEIDVSNGRTKVAEQPDPMAQSYVADQDGEVRLKVRQLSDNRGVLTGETVYMYREPGKRSWKMMGEIIVDGKPLKEFEPVAVDGPRNVAYGYETLNGYSALIEVPLDGSNTGRVIMARDDVDVGSLIQIGRQKRVVGGTFQTEKRTIQYFDSELDALSKALGNALPNKPLVSIVSASADESRLLLIASSDTDPGTVYLYDKGTRQLEQLLAVREFLVDQDLAKVTPISFPASDGTQIPGYLTMPSGTEGKNLPTIVLPHGGPAARDTWGFDWLAQFFAARGYAVLQPNFRGSAGYGEAWFGNNGYRAWDVAIGDVNDAGKWMVSEGIADPSKLAIVGWSYGGYAALQSQVADPDLYQAVVAIAPVTDLEYLRNDARAYTHYELRDKQLGSGPHIVAGSPLQHAESFKAPVALFHGERDVNVDVRHSRAMADRLKDAGKSVTYAEYDGLRHGLRDSKVRTEMLIAIDGFLARSLGK